MHRFREANAEDYPLFNEEKYFEMDIIPKMTIDYYKDCYSRGISPLLFHGVNHVLVKGEIDISQMEVIG